MDPLISNELERARNAIGPRWNVRYHKSSPACPWSAKLMVGGKNMKCHLWASSADELIDLVGSMSNLLAQAVAAGVTRLITGART